MHAERVRAKTEALHRSAAPYLIRHQLWRSLPDADGRDDVVEIAQIAGAGAIGAAIIVAGIVADGDAVAVGVADRGDAVVPGGPDIGLAVAFIHAEALAGVIGARIEAHIARLAAR